VIVPDDCTCECETPEAIGCPAVLEDCDLDCNNGLDMDDNGCTMCKCRELPQPDQDLDCRFVACAAIACNAPVVKPGQCCPECGVVSIDNPDDDKVLPPMILTKTTHTCSSDLDVSCPDQFTCVATDLPDSSCPDTGSCSTMREVFVSCDAPAGFFDGAIPISVDKRTDCTSSVDCTEASIDYSDTSAAGPSPKERNLECVPVGVNQQTGQLLSKCARPSARMFFRIAFTLAAPAQGDAQGSEYSVGAQVSALMERYSAPKDAKLTISTSTPPTITLIVPIHVLSLDLGASAIQRARNDAEVATLKVTYGDDPKTEVQIKDNSDGTSSFVLDVAHKAQQEALLSQARGGALGEFTGASGLPAWAAAAIAVAALLAVGMCVVAVVLVVRIQKRNQTAAMQQTTLQHRTSYGHRRQPSRGHSRNTSRARNVYGGNSTANGYNRKRSSKKNFNPITN